MTSIWGKVGEKTNQSQKFLRPMVGVGWDEEHDGSLFDSGMSKKNHQKTILQIIWSNL